MILLDFIKSHENWEELLSDAPYYLKISRDEGYIMFKYNQLSSDFTNSIVKEARGIIFREKDWKCVCHAFDKFMNAEEEHSDLAKIDWKTASCQEKIDGSLMKVWYDNGWHISTNGTIDAFKAPLECADKNLDSYGKLFLYCLKKMGINEHHFFSMLDEEDCYMFEMISPYNRVVIDYKEHKLYYLGRRNLDIDCEFSFIGDNPFENGLGCLIPTPTVYNLHTFEDIKNAANALPWDEEGYVVCDTKCTENGSFLRVKIKSPEYVLAHRGRMNGNVSVLRLINLILINEVSEFICYASEYTDKINALENAINDFKLKIKLAIDELKPETFNTRKEFAEKVKNNYPNHWQSFIFNYDRLEESFSKLVPSQWKKILEKEGSLS